MGCLSSTPRSADAPAQESKPAHTSDKRSMVRKYSVSSKYQFVELGENELSEVAAVHEVLGLSDS